MKKHPQLAGKLELLYKLRVNPAIRSHADLARNVGVTRQSVSRWCRGTPTTNGNCVPHYQVVAVAGEFDIDPNWLTLESEDFEQRLRNRLDLKERSLNDNVVKISTATMPITGIEIFGRENELELLDSYWQDPKVNVVQLIAFGGVGKSSLINRWLSELSKDNYRTARRVYAWSFYWQGDSSELKSSGDSFMEHALHWFGDEEPTAGTPWAKASRLAQLVRSSSTLLVLDGLEPMQHGPGKKSGQVENPSIALFIRELAAENTGLCVITSRLPVTDLKPYSDNRVAIIDLDHISEQAGLDLLRSRGVHGSQVLIGRVARKYIGHPLSLSLLGGYIKVVHKGDASRFSESTSLADEQEQSDHCRVLIRQYLDWQTGSPAEQMLYLISMFDRTVHLDDIKALVDSNQIDGLTSNLRDLLAAKWSYSLKQLEDANLISVRDYKNHTSIDCHPIVRDFVADYLKKENPRLWTEGNEAIFYMLQESAVANPSSMNELEPLFRAVIHGAQAGKYEESFRLYFEKIKKGYTMLTEGSHYADQSCIRALFVNEWTEPVGELPLDSQYHLISSAAANLMSLGMINEAIDPSLKCIRFFKDNGLWQEATDLAGPLLSMLIEAGDLNRANELIDELQGCVKQANNPVLTAMGRNFQAYIAFLCGQDQIAEKLFDQVEEVLNLSDPGIPVSFPTISFYYCRFLLATGKEHEALERSLRTFAWRKQKTWQVAIDTKSLLALDLLVLGLIFLELGDHINARVQLDHQVELFRGADEWLYLPSGLNSRARLHIVSKDFTAALSDLEESLKISRQTGARFREWEAYLDMAQLHFSMRDYKNSEKFLSKAKGLPKMEMYRFRNAEILELENNLAARLCSQGMEDILVSQPSQ